MSPKWLMQPFPCMSTSTKIRSWTDQYAPSEPTCSTARSHSAGGLPHHLLAVLTRCTPSAIPRRPPLQSSPCFSIVSSERHPLTTTSVNHPHRCRTRRRQCRRWRPLPSIILCVFSSHHPQNVSSERHPLTTTAVNLPHRCRTRRRQCSRW